MSSYATYTSLALLGAISADLNGDGLLDLLAFNFPADDIPSDGTFVVFFGQPDGGLGAPVSYPGGIPRGIGDLNGDGYPDVVAGTFGQGAGTYGQGGGAQVFLNDGAGGLVLSGTVTTAGEVISVGIGDLNADGLADLALGESSSGGIVSAEVAFGNGLGGFSAPVALPNLGYPLVVADLNQDGFPDIAAATSDDSQLAVLLNQGDGGFRTSLYAATVAAIAVLPTSGHSPDLVLSGGQGVQVLKNSGDGTFVIGPKLQAPGGFYLAIGDFNGDCFPDVATSFASDCTNWEASVLYGDGDGGFAPAVSLRGIGFVGFLAALGPVENPRALATDTAGGCFDAGIIVYGDASKP